MVLPVRFPSRRILLQLPMVCFAVSAHAEVSADAVRIGVLNDQSGVYADFGGPGAVVAARMAVESQQGRVLGRPIEVLIGDHQSKPDIGVAIARQWFDADNATMVIGFDNSSVALAVEQLAAQKNRIAIAGAVATTDFTGKACTPNEAAWVYDSYALTTSLASALVRQGQDTWFFVTVDYAFGHALEKDTSDIIKADGGKVLGSVLTPLNTSDYSSFLLQAQSSKSKIVGLANAGADTVNSIKQAAEFGIVAGGQRLAALLMTLAEVHGLGLEAAQGLVLTESYYWDLNDRTREFGERYYKRTGRMPNMIQAGTYSATLQYLKAVKAAGTKDSDAVAKKLKELPVDDAFRSHGHVQANGRMVSDLYLFQVKKPSESKRDWDYYNLLATVPGDTAYPTAANSGCPLTK